METAAAHAQSANPPGPLAGYRVLDLTTPLGVYCTKLLANLGADVVRVEPPAGDPMRAQPPLWRAPNGDTLSLYYLHMNAGKRAVALDLATPEGRAALLRLVDHADILIDSHPPGHLAALGLDYPTLRERNPRLVQTSISPFGLSGPYRDYQASDLVGQAMGGVMAITGYPDGPPLRLASDQGYHTVALHACAATLLALYHRNVTGEGQQIDASLQETLAVAVQPATQAWDMKREVMGLTNTRFGSRAPCKDGYMSIAMGRPEAFARMAEWLDAQGLGEGLKDIQWPELGTEWPPAAAAARQRLTANMNTLFGRLTRAELAEESQQWRMWFAPVNTAKEVLADVQLNAREFFQPVDYPEQGATLKHPGAPFKLSATPWRIARRAPLPAEHDAAAIADEWENLTPQPPFPAKEGGRDEVTPAPPPCAGVGRGEARGIPPRGVRRGAPPARRLPLEGIRILDFTWVAAGPLAAKMCADHGAQVILVESGTRVGGLRATEPMPPGTSGPNVSGWWNNLNSGKLGITLNLKSREGLDLIRRLVAISDVVMDNFTPGVMPRWGLDYASLVQIKPDIIAMSMPMMGCTGPRREVGGFGSTPPALCGIHYLTQVPGRGPAVTNHAFADHASNAGHGATALLAALLHRQRTGEGQFIDLSQYESTANFNGPYLLEYAATGTAREPDGNHTPEAAPHNAYPCAGEDRWCVIAVFDDAEWAALRGAMGDPTWAGDARFATLAGRKAHETALDEGIAAWTRTLAPEAVMDRLQAVGVAAGVVQNGRDLHEDPHLRARDYFFPLDHAEAGRWLHQRLGYRLLDTPADYRQSPMLGEHNRQVFGALLGLSDAEIDALVAAGVIA